MIGFQPPFLVALQRNGLGATRRQIATCCPEPAVRFDESFPHKAMLRVRNIVTQGVETADRAQGEFGWAVEGLRVLPAEIDLRDD